MTGEFYLPEISCGGGALFDFDNDGDLDVFLVQGQLLGPGKDLGMAILPPADPELRDRLWRNDLTVLPDGRRQLRFTDVTAASGMVAPGYGCGVATGDFDNDGWVDLYLAQLGSNQLWRNQGDGTFRDVTAGSYSDDPRWSTSASFADVDGDGWLDLYVANYLDFSYAQHKICRTATGARDYCSPDAYVGVPDTLLRNRGDGTFANITASAGIDRVRSKSLAVAAADFNQDGRIDFYVANDGVANQLWIQRADGRFQDEALLAGCAVNGRGQAEAGMGVAVGDFDRDLDLDVFKTNLSGETNTLFVNDGRGAFEDQSTSSGLGPPSWSVTSWGTAWLDYDHDGWLDVLTVSGAVRTIEAQANTGDPFPFRQTRQLFRNLGDGRFEDKTAAAGPAFVLPEVGRGLAIGDLDNDGDLDALVINNSSPARILLNQVGQDQPWLSLRLVGVYGNSGRPRDMLGARALLRHGGRTSLRHVHTDGSFASASDPRVHFGLGSDARGKADPEPLSVRVIWPDGRVEEWTDLVPGRTTTLLQGSGRKIP